jgi:integrase
VNHPVKHKTVTITVYQWRHSSGREYWRYRRNDGKVVTRSTLEAAKEDAMRHAKDIHRGTLDLTTLPPEQIRKLQRIVEADPSLALVDEFLIWHGRYRSAKLCADAVAEFLAVKEANAGPSPHHIRTLRRSLTMLPQGMTLADIRVSDLPTLPGAARTRKNVQSAWVTFFKWCQDREWLPHGEKTAPERLEKPRIVRGVPETFTPAELRTLLANVRPQYLPWLALVALGGLRTEEVVPQQASRKDSLRWEDIHLDRRIIIVRAETAKTGHRRVIPIGDRLAAILAPVAGTGHIGPRLYPSKPLNAQSVAETTRLGALVGGWRRNALRHSFISFRAALVGLAQTAMEAGNSESEAKRSYNDAKTREEAEEWFSVLPNVPINPNPAESRHGLY